MRDPRDRWRSWRLACSAVAVFALILFALMTSVLVARAVAFGARAGGEVGQEVPPTPPISTAAGVYSAAQATRGEETYMAICVACHPRGTYSTAAFKTAWTGRPLVDLFDLVKEKMPKNDPATLTPGEYAQVIAYLLKINDVPAGEHELASDSEALKKIRIELEPREH